MKRGQLSNVGVEAAVSKLWGEKRTNPKHWGFLDYYPCFKSQTRVKRICWTEKKAGRVIMFLPPCLNTTAKRLFSRLEWQQWEERERGERTSSQGVWPSLSLASGSAPCLMRTSAMAGRSQRSV